MSSIVPEKKKSTHSKNLQWVLTICQAELGTGKSWLINMFPTLNLVGETAQGSINHSNMTSAWTTCINISYLLNLTPPTAIWEPGRSSWNTNPATGLLKTINSFPVSLLSGESWRCYVDRCLGKTFSWSNNCGRLWDKLNEINQVSLIYDLSKIIWSSEPCKSLKGKRTLFSFFFDRGPFLVPLRRIIAQRTDLGEILTDFLMPNLHIMPPMDSHNLLPKLLLPTLIPAL